MRSYANVAERNRDNARRDMVTVERHLTQLTLDDDQKERVKRNEYRGYCPALRFSLNDAERMCTNRTDVFSTLRGVTHTRLNAIARC